MTEVHPLAKMSESETVDWLFRSPTGMYNAISFMVQKALGHNQLGWKLSVWLETPRQDIGLEVGSKPGDIDILIVPELDGDRFAEKAMSIEVKRAYIPEIRLEKSPGSFGVSQVKGMLRDGFPYVGLLHVIFVEAASQDYRVSVPLFDNKGDQNGLAQLGDVEMPYSSMIVAQRHEGRVLKTEIPDVSGYNMHVFQLNGPTDGFLGQNMNENRAPLKNPDSSEGLISSIRKFAAEPDYVIGFEYGTTRVSEARERQLSRAFKGRVDKAWRIRSAP